MPRVEIVARYLTGRQLESTVRGTPDGILVKHYSDRAEHLVKLLINFGGKFLMLFVTTGLSTKHGGCRIPQNKDLRSLESVISQRTGQRVPVSAVGFTDAIKPLNLAKYWSRLSNLR